MSLFLFTNYFPFKTAESFLINEFEFTKRNFSSITVWSCYGEFKDAYFKSDQQVQILQPVLGYLEDQKKIFSRGFFNSTPFWPHIKDFFEQKVFLSPKKLYWFLISFLMTRTILSTKAYEKIITEINNTEKPVLYFYWGNNICWIIPYLRKRVKSKDLKIIIRLHRTDLYAELTGGYAALREQIFSLATAIVPISKDGEDYLRARYPAFGDKIYLSRLGVFDHGLNPVSFADVKNIISVSSLIEVKRVNLIFEALQKTKHKIVWHHFGDGPLADSIKELVKQKRDNLEIIFYGYLNNEILINFYQNQAINVFINVSASEGLPVSIMEALSFGVPVIATSVGGIPELVDKNVGCLIKPDFTTDQLVTEIDRILMFDAEQRLVVGENARRVFEKKVSAEINFPDFYKYVNSL